MKYLKKFNESTGGGEKMELLKDVFGDLDVYFDVGVSYNYSGIDIIWGDPIPHMPRKKIGVVRFITVNIELNGKLTIDLLEKLVELTNMALSYCDVKFERWDIFSRTSSLLQSSKNLVYVDGDNPKISKSKIVSKDIDSIKDLYQDKNPNHPNERLPIMLDPRVGEIRIEFKEDMPHTTSERD